MSTFVVVADSARARFFVYPGAVDADGVSKRLVETKDMVCPTRRSRVGDLARESRPGLRASGASRHGVDDHRDQHREEVERAFAVDVARAIAAECEGSRLILYAAPSLLGKLRPALEHHAEVDQSSMLIKQALDLSKLSSSQLHDRLAKDKLLPNRRVLHTNRDR